VTTGPKAVKAPEAAHAAPAAVAAIEADPVKAETAATKGTPGTDPTKTPAAAEAKQVSASPPCADDGKSPGVNVLKSSTKKKISPAIDGSTKKCDGCSLVSETAQHSDDADDETNGVETEDGEDANATAEERAEAFDCAPGDVDCAERRYAVPELREGPLKILTADGHYVEATHSHVTPELRERGHVQTKPTEAAKKTEKTETTDKTTETPAKKETPAPAPTPAKA
jgi:hypothetical protein